MPNYNQNMKDVQAFGDLLPGGWFHVRVEKGEERMSKESNQPTWALWMKIQNEPFVGQVIFDQPSLQPHALAKLKAYYKAAGYDPGPEGHDPEKLNGTEFYILLVEEVYQGDKRMKVPPYGIKSMQEGPKGQMAKGKSA